MVQYFVLQDKKDDRDSVVDIPPFLIKWPPLLVAGGFILTVLLMAVGGKSSWAPDQEQFKPPYVFCVLVERNHGLSYCSNVQTKFPHGLASDGPRRRRPIALGSGDVKPAVSTSEAGPSAVKPGGREPAAVLKNEPVSTERRTGRQVECVDSDDTSGSGVEVAAVRPIVPPLRRFRRRSRPPHASQRRGARKWCRAATSHQRKTPHPDFEPYPLWSLMNAFRRPTGSNSLAIRSSAGFIMRRRLLVHSFFGEKRTDTNNRHQ